MVYITPLIGAVAIFSGIASALPRPQDSGIGNEVAVSAPNGTPITDTIELASQTKAEAEAKQTQYGSYGEGQEYSSTVEEYSSMAEETTSMMEYETTSTMEHEMTTTSSATYSTPTYGSGSTTWGGSGYDDCVQQCIASYGAPPATYSPTATSGHEGSTGGGATVTVMVAPKQGVLRYVPFAVNASVGTTIEFRWGGGPHTVTKGSALLPCNKSTEDPVFASGQQEKDFIFTQVVNDTKPTYYFCGVGQHCNSGMFAIINPPMDINGGSSVGGMMQEIMANNSDLKAYAAYTANATSGKAGSNWGSGISMKDMPEWAHSLVAENVLYTRSFLALNQETAKEDGAIDFGNMVNTPLMFPEDVGAAINAAGSPTSGAVSGSTDAASTAASSAASDASATSAPSGNGASAVASPKVLVALMAVVATFLAL
ncbi:extracellular serine-rich [Moniliophthora roreri MCA 2997]|uniref:Extracellular serine-rich n=2 Tax=Moniliophthora roreri TaxID=221103 RepID=V2XVN2_MONRO|nr:extracellular serine-rich [Moniliophthora roreri MCA 2997]KAI3610819.1 extracellular serine-rich [Moniliophthora roreri]